MTDSVVPGHELPEAGQSEAARRAEPGEAAGPRHGERGARIALGVVLFGGSFAVSFAGSWIPSLWADEGASISAARRTLPELWTLVHNIDMVHALYYALLSLWSDLVPLDAFWLRLPSAVAVAASTVLVHRLAARWGTPRTAILAAAVFAVLPRVTWMGAEGRSWAFSTLVAIGLTFSAVLWNENRRARWLVEYGVLAALGIALHLYLVLLVLAHAVALLWRLRRSPLDFARWVLAGVVGVGLASPVWLVALRQSAQIGDMKPGLLAWVRQFAVNQALLGETPGPGASGALDLAWKAGSVGLAAVCWVLVAIAAYGVLRRRDWAPAPDVVWWLGPWLLLPPGVILGWSLIGRNLYNPRYFGFCVPAMAILVAFGLIGLGRRWRQVVALGLIGALAAPVYLSQRIPRAKSGSDWAEVASWVQQRSVAGDGVYFAPVPTTRTISIAYPEEFARLRDLTLLRSPAEDGSLAGSSKPLIDVLGGSPDEVFAVWRLGAVSYVEDQGQFAAAGFTPVDEWSGSLHEVVRYARVR